MPVLPINLGPAHWDGPNAGSFIPNGPLVYHGDRSVWNHTSLHKNPILFGGETGKQKGIWSARIFVGLSVGPTPRWTPDDVVRLVREFRTQQIGRADSSFVVQRGLYTGAGGAVVDETSVQVAILNLPYWNIDKKAFREQMVELADHLAIELEQESVILEIQKNGVLKYSWTVGPQGGAQ